jgi:predicted nuclease with TOPRIM domain
MTEESLNSLCQNVSKLTEAVEKSLDMLKLLKKQADHLQERVEYIEGYLTGLTEPIPKRIQ